MKGYTSSALKQVCGSLCRAPINYTGGHQHSLEYCIQVVKETKICILTFRRKYGSWCQFSLAISSRPRRQKSGRNNLLPDLGIWVSSVHLIFMNVNKALNSLLIWLDGPTHTHQDVLYNSWLYMRALAQSKRQCKWLLRPNPLPERKCVPTLSPPIAGHSDKPQPAKRIFSNSSPPGLRMGMFRSVARKRWRGRESEREERTTAIVERWRTERESR